MTAEKKEQTVSETPASVVIITAKTIEDFGFTSYTELLNYVTGLYVIDDYYWLGSVNYGVRGFYKNGASSNMVILVDGVSQLSDKYSDYPDVKITIPIESIERIEIVRGPMSVIYGNGAFFGAINIITRPTNATSNNNKVLAGIGSFNRFKAGVKLTEQTKDFSYSAIIGYDQNDGLEVPYTDLTTNINYLEYAGLDSNSTTKNHMNSKHIYSGLNVNYKNISVKLNFNQSVKGVFDGIPSYHNGTKLNTRALNSVIEYSKDFSKRLSTTLHLGYYYHSHLLNYEIFRKYYYEVDYQHTSSYDIDLNLFYTPSKYLEFTTGISRRTAVNILQISDFGYYGLNYGDGKIGLPEGESFSTHALYEQVTFTPHSKIKLVGGLRIEHLEPYNMYYSRGVVSEDSADNRLPNDLGNRYIIESEFRPANNGFTITPRAAVIYEFIPNHILKFLYGEANKQPSFTENYRQLLGNKPTLYSSKIQTFEINYLTTILKTININSSVFYNRLYNLIKATNIYDFETGTWDLYSANSGEMQTKGAELVISYQPMPKLYAQVSGIYQETEDLSVGYEDFTTAYSPNTMVYASISYQPIKKLSLSCTYKYTGEMQSEIVLNTDSSSPNWERIAQPTSAFSVLNFNLRIKDIAVKNSFINMYVSNLLNTEIRYPTTTNNKWIDKGTLAPGRNILLTVGYKF